MTQGEETANGHRLPPTPCAFPDSQDQNGSKDSTNNFNPPPISPTPTTEPFPANAYHVPPPRYAPRAHAYRHDDTLDLPRKPSLSPSAASSCSPTDANAPWPAPTYIPPSATITPNQTSNCSATRHPH